MKNQYQTLKGEEAPFKPEALSKIFPQKEVAMPKSYVEKQANRNFVMINQADTINDLKYIQDIIYNNSGMDISLQQVVNHLIHFYLKER